MKLTGALSHPDLTVNCVRYFLIPVSDSGAKSIGGKTFYNPQGASLPRASLHKSVVK